MTFRAQAGEAPLAQCLIHAHGHRIGQVEGAGGIVVDHGQTYAAVRIVVQQAFRQALGLLAEDQVRAVGIGNVAVDMAGFGGKIEEGAGVSGKKVVQVLVIGNVQKGPVVQARRFSFLSSMVKPMGSTRWRRAPVAAQVRLMLPVFCGISGSTSTIFSCGIRLLPSFPTPGCTAAGRVRSAWRSFRRAGTRWRPFSKAAPCHPRRSARSRPPGRAGR